MMRSLLLATTLLCASPALAGYSGTPAGGASVTMGGDVSGSSAAATVTGLNGAAPGGNCPTGQAMNGVSNQAQPAGCFTPTATATPPHPGYKAGAFYMPIGPSNEQNNAAVPSVSTMVCSFGGIGGTNAIKLLALYIRLLTAGTTTFQAGIYTNDTTAFGISRPGTLIGVTGQVVNTATGPASGNLTNGPFTVAPGFFWWCLEEGDTTAKHQTRAGTAVDFQEMQTVGGSTAAIALGNGSNQMSGVATTVSGYGTFPTSFPSSTSWTEIGGTAPAFRFTVSN